MKGRKHIECKHDYNDNDEDSIHGRKGATDTLEAKGQIMLVGKGSRVVVLAMLLDSAPSVGLFDDRGSSWSISVLVGVSASSFSVSGMRQELTCALRHTSQLWRDVACFCEPFVRAQSILSSAA